MEPFAGAPSPVDAALAGLGVVDLLVATLADVTDPHVAVGAIEGESPRVAQPVHPNLCARAGSRDERVVGRHRVRRRARRLRVDTQDLAEPGMQVLRVPERVAAASAVAEADVQ